MVVDRAYTKRVFLKAIAVSLEHFQPICYRKIIGMDIGIDIGIDIGMDIGKLLLVFGGIEEFSF